MAAVGRAGAPGEGAGPPRPTRSHSGGPSEREPQEELLPSFACVFFGRQVPSEAGGAAVSTVHLGPEGDLALRTDRGVFFSCKKRGQGCGLAAERSRRC